MKTAKIILFFIAIVFLTSAQAISQTSRNYQARKQIKSSRTNAFGNTPKTSEENDASGNKFERCQNGLISQRLLAEYGAVFSADSNKVILPPTCFFKNESEVQQFQRRAGVSTEVVGGIRVELQPQALKAYLAARAEARQIGLDITPRGSDASRRSFADTLALWDDQVSDGLAHWLGKGNLTKREAERLRALPRNKQVAEILKLERQGLYFGNGFKKSILQSVAAPGSSQHNLMLALDVEQHSNPKVRAILAKYGWFQTVQNDLPHFTYLGLKESQLSAIGLKQTSASGRRVWIPATETASTETPPANSENDDEADILPRPPSKRFIGIPATFSPMVIITEEMEPSLRLITQEYFKQTGQMLHITSGYRPPDKQAKAMYDILVNYRDSYYFGIYRRTALSQEIYNAYFANRLNSVKALLNMSRTIEEQVKRKQYVSKHLLKSAFDIRLTANAPVLRQIARKLGGEFLKERDHYHIEF
jgi:LAS superfamily LD-carboxypeptidase LdcB